MKKILLIDDDQHIRETIEEFLIYEKYDVITASNGQDALDKLDNWVPDLFICDIMMPVMDGHTFHEIIKNDKLLNSIPFIFLTAKKEKNLMRNCLLEGADDFISKPFKIKELTKTIETKIERFEKIKNSYPNLYSGEKKILLHEINTPMNGILGSIDLLLDHKNELDNDELNLFHNAIKTSGERLNRTLQNLFLYQRLIENKVEHKKNSICKVAFSYLKIKNQLNKNYEHIENRLLADFEDYALNIDPAYLEIALYELIDNALKFSDNNSVLISGKKFNESNYEIIIADQGIGFTEEDLKNINYGIQFNRVNREQQGLGLGLALSKSLITLARGVFSIVSEENKGTVITIYIPLYNANPLGLLN